MIDTRIIEALVWCWRRWRNFFAASLSMVSLHLSNEPLLWPEVLHPPLFSSLVITAGDRQWWDVSSEWYPVNGIRCLWKIYSHQVLGHKFCSTQSWSDQEMLRTCWRCRLCITGKLAATHTLVLVTISAVTRSKDMATPFSYDHNVGITLTNVFLAACKMLPLNTFVWW